MIVLKRHKPNKMHINTIGHKPPYCMQYTLNKSQIHKTTKFRTCTLDMSNNNNITKHISLLPCTHQLHINIKHTIDKLLITSTTLMVTTDLCDIDDFGTIWIFALKLHHITNFVLALSTKILINFTKFYTFMLSFPYQYLIFY